MYIGFLVTYRQGKVEITPQTQEVSDFLDRAVRNAKWNRGVLTVTGRRAASLIKRLEKLGIDYSVPQFIK